MSTEQPMIGTTEAAKILAITPETLRRWAERQLIPHTVLPTGRLRFAHADLEAAQKRVPAA